MPITNSSISTTLPTPQSLGLVIPDGPEGKKVQDQIMVLMAILHGLTANTFSPDIVELSLIHAQGICLDAGVDPDTTEAVIRAYLRYSEVMRSRNPISGMF